MSKDRSFKAYVAHRFYNELFYAVRDYLNRNTRTITTKSQQVRQVDHAWLSDIAVKHVYVEDRPGTRIAFDVLVEAYFEVSERDRSYDRYADEADWFKISCTGDLAQNLDDFWVFSIEVYNARGRQHNPLSDALVPIIRREQLEDVAKDFLTKYYPEALKGSVAVYPPELACRIGLSVLRQFLGRYFSSIVKLSTITTRLMSMKRLPSRVARSSLTLLISICAILDLHLTQ